MNLQSTLDVLIGGTRGPVDRNLTGFATTAHLPGCASDKRVAQWHIFFLDNLTFPAALHPKVSASNPITQVPGSNYISTNFVPERFPSSKSADVCAVWLYYITLQITLLRKM